MSVVLYIVLALVGIFSIVVLVQANRKSTYGKAVYQELELLPDGQDIKFIVQNHPDETLRMNIAMMQIEILKQSHKKGLPPSVTAQAMMGAINEMLEEKENHS